MRWRNKQIKQSTAERQKSADEALAKNAEIAKELDALENQFLASMERLRRLNKENNFATRLERQAYQ